VTVYADSSFLVAVYVATAHTPIAFRLWREIGQVPLPFNAMHRLEVRNSIRRSIRETRPERRLDRHSAKLALDALEEDLGEDLLHQPLNWTDVFRRAEEIGERWTMETGIRAYDLFHLAAAIETRHDTVLTFDGCQAETARKLGVTVLGG